MLRFFKHPRRRDIILWGLLVIYLALLALLGWEDPELLVFYRNSLHPELSGTAICVMAVTYLYLLATGILCCFYRPQPTIREDSQLPSCTVIVPAYNEGAHVEQTIKSLLKSDYPADKFEIIVINDGSEDDTWEYIMRGVAGADKRITPINLPANCGKKHALYVGSKKASGEIIVTVDSDSLVEEHTIRALVSPMKNPRIGAVAGAIKAKNADQSYVASLLDVLLVFFLFFGLLFFWV